MRRDPNCTLCKLHQTAEYVCLLGAGDTPNEIAIIGEAPGHREDDSGVPFVGKAGQLLERELATIDLDREDVYITNAVHCRPPDNKTPTKSQIATCKAWLDYEMKRVKPKYVLLLGNTPLQSITGSAGIKKMRGKPFEKDGVVYLPTWHPAYVLRDDRQLATFRRDLRKFREIIDFGGIPEERSLDFTIVDSWERVRAMIRAMVGTVSVDLETSRLYPFWTITDEAMKNGTATKEQIADHKATHGNLMRPHIVCFNFGTASKQWILPGEESGVWTRLELEEIIEQVTDALADCYTVYHNGKFDILWMRVRFGVHWEVDFDTMLADYMLDENRRHGLDEVASRELGAPDWDIDLKEKWVWSPKNAKYAAHDVFYTRKLRFILGKQLHEDGMVERVFKKILMPCVGLFAEAEFDGVYIDQDKMDDAEVFLRDARDTAHKELQKIIGKREVNWNSPKQVTALFLDLKVPLTEKTPTGNFSVSESVLLQLDHPIAGALLKWRAAEKQLSSFIEGWKPYIDLNGYLHPSFKLHGTVTGRLSCENPNLQQVPRDPRIRSLITAPDGWWLIEADLSQIELRIAAELANERNMLQAFINEVDAHWLTAIREIARGAGMKDEVLETAYRWKQKKVGYADAIEMLLQMGPDTAAELMPEWKELRKKAKAINFGYLFGMWWKKFKLYARDNYGVHLSDKEAQESRVAFFELYPDLPEWHEKQRRYARLNGYVRSLSGRKRRLPEAMGRDSPERREAERQAINSPVQSFANELNLMAALQLRREYGRNAVRLCGTVHDACLFRVREDLVPEVYTRMLEIMSGPDMLEEFEIELTVPVIAEAKIGPWGAGKGLEKWQKEQSSTR